MAASEKERLRRRVKNLRRALKNAEEEAGKSDQAETTGQPPAAPHDSAPTGPNSDPPSNTDQPHTAGNNPPKQKRKISLHRDSVFFPIAEIVLAFAIMAATLAQAIIGKLQWDAMQTQNADTFRQAQLAQKATEQTDKTLELMRQEQRPWLSATLPAKNPVVVGEDVQVELPIVNSGPTTAWLKSGAVGFVLQVGDESIDRMVRKIWRDADQRTRSDVIAPGVTMTFHATIESLLRSIRDKPIEQAAVESIRADVESGAMTLYLVGRWTYVDTFETPHFLEVCFVYKHASKEFFAHQQYNDMD